MGRGRLRAATGGDDRFRSEVGGLKGFCRATTGRRERQRVGFACRWPAQAPPRQQQWCIERL
eukprot:scaffold133_cov257-Pinguiococcus_pyrenoidosus.AAC.22